MKLQSLPTQSAVLGIILNSLLAKQKKESNDTREEQENGL